MNHVLSNIEEAVSKLTTLEAAAIMKGDAKTAHQLGRAIADLNGVWTRCFNLSKKVA